MYVHIRVWTDASHCVDIQTIRHPLYEARWHTPVYIRTCLDISQVCINSRRWASSLIFISIRIIFCSTFRCKFRAKKTLKYKKGPYSSWIYIYFQDRCWIPLGRVILEHFVSRVDSKKWRRKKRSYLLCENCSAWAILRTEKKVDTIVNTIDYNQRHVKTKQNAQK